MTTHLDLAIQRPVTCRRLLHQPILVAIAFLIPCLSLTTDTGFAQENSKPFEKRFWQFLIGNNYKNWAPAPGQDGEFYNGRTPHGSLQKLYINRLAAGDVKGLKAGSVLVLENYLSDKSLKSISVMYRTEGYNPKANDWFWVEYNPDGSVAEKIGTMTPDESATIMLTSATSSRLAGKATSCIDCHRKAAGSDYAFFNDGKDSAVAERKPAKSLSLN